MTRPPLALAIALALCGAARASPGVWSTDDAVGPNEVVFTLDVLCADSGLVCDLLDGYVDTQTASVSGAGTLEVDVLADTLQFQQDGTQDLMDGMGARPAYLTVDASDLVFAVIPLVGAPMTEGGAVFGLSNPALPVPGLRAQPGVHPFSGLVSYSAVADVVGALDPFVPFIAVTPNDVSVSGELALIEVTGGGAVAFEIRDLTATLNVQNPATLLGENVTIDVTADMTLNLSGQLTGVAVPAFGPAGLALLAAVLAASGARAAQRRREEVP